MRKGIYLTGKKYSILGIKSILFPAATIYAADRVKAPLPPFGKILRITNYERKSGVITYVCCILL